MYLCSSSQVLFMGLQMEGAQYICELCQKHGKSIGSTPISEDSKMKVTSLQIELKNVSSDSTVSPQMPWRHGKVCISV